ncbi:MAG: SpoIIE family protein phosphatase [Acidobacteriota bacterium]|nr:SpoIIE family protein phosphatase [Acidobacteriota bacterium]
MSDSSKLAPFFLFGFSDGGTQHMLSTPKQAETLGLLYEVSRELTSILDREELLRRIAQHVKRIVDYHLFTVMLWNEGSQLLESVFAMHYDDAIPARLRMRLNQGITGLAAGERRPIRVGDVREDSRYMQCATDTEVRAEMVVPLLLQDRLIGVLDLESTVPEAFTLEHERLLATMGSYVAIALENARLYQEARENERRLQDDLNTAREIQRQLLPKGAREVPGLDLAAAYAPARELGGDFYDFQPYGEGRLAFALGDVSGKGTAAALYGSLAIGTLREVVMDRTLSAAKMLSLLNQRMYAARMEAKFIALLFGIYDASGRRLTIANAGEPYPLLIRNGSTSEIEISGMPLGLFGDTQYEEITVDLLPGDVVVCASDGITDSEDAGEEAFGTGRFRDLLSDVVPMDSALEIADRILTATEEFSGLGNASFDDRTLVVLRVVDDSSSDFSKLPIIY